MPRHYRVYFRLWGKYYLRTGWKILYSNSEVRRVLTVTDNTFEYAFRGRPRLIVKEW